MPISALILALLAVPLSALDPRAGRSANLGLALLIYILYNNFLSIFQAWTSQGKLNGLIGLWPVHLVFSALTFYMLYRRAKQLPIFPNISQYLRAHEKKIKPQLSSTSSANVHDNS